MFLILKEIEGGSLEQISQRNDATSAILDAISHSQEKHNLDSVISIVEESSQACARFKAEVLSIPTQAELIKALDRKLQIEIARVRI